MYVARISYGKNLNTISAKIVLIGTENNMEKRTEPQNNAGHKWFRMLAETLNDAGVEQKITFGTADCPWTEQAVKAMCKKISNAMYGKVHTSELTKQEFSMVAETLNRVVSEKGISVPFPSVEELIREEEFENWKNKMPKKEKKEFEDTFEG